MLLRRPTSWIVLGPLGGQRSISHSRCCDMSLQIMQSMPQTTFVILVHRGRLIEKIGWVVTDKLGRAELVLDTRRGDFLPMLQARDVIRLWVHKQPMLSGQLREP